MSYSASRWAGKVWKEGGVQKLEDRISNDRSPHTEGAASQPAIVGPALVIALGNVLSRLLGLAREAVMADTFGATGLVSAYRIAAIVPTMLHDLLVGGMVSSALVPVFSEYAERDQMEFWQLANLVITLACVVLGGIALLGELLAPQIAWLLGGGFPPPLLEETIRLMRITIPAVLFLSLSSILSGLLYSLRRFAFPAFTTAVFNASIVLVVLLAAGRWGIRSMALGLLAGAMLQVALQLPGLHSMRFTPRLDLQDEGLRRILRLSLPILGGLVISQIAVVIDRNLASRTGEQTIAWMQYATTLIQFPLGLVAAAISLSLLPSLSRYTPHWRQGENLEGGQRLTAFRTLLGQGLRWVLLLTIPATVGLLILAEPVVRLLFQHGDFTPTDTAQTALALRVYLLGLTFAAVDQPLIFAFYALQDTSTPAIVGALSVGVYLAVALLLLGPLGMIGLVLANSLQWACHALVMIWLLRRRLGGMAAQRIWTAGAQALLAAAIMSMVVIGARWQMETLENRGTLSGKLLAVIAPMGLGGLSYVGALAVLRLEECRTAWQWLRDNSTKLL